MEKYLYAAAVQGIQSFIFQTNRLKEIVGASELVEEICTSAFSELLGESYDEKNLVIAAAGNVKYIFDSREDCEKAVAEFPRKVMTMAPGITISQAVVMFSDGDDFGKTIDAVEKLLRAQRNRIQPPLALGLIGIRRAPGTGLPAEDAVVVRGAKNPAAEDILLQFGIRSVLIDASTKSKLDRNSTLSLCSKSFYGPGCPADDRRLGTLPSRVLTEVSEICARNDWLAVIHADGNSLGQVVRSVGRDRTMFSEFSRELDRATVLSANEAFGQFSPPETEDPAGPAAGEEAGPLWTDDGKSPIPLRPIVLGGDDMTVIIRGDLAVPYLEKYMSSFERHTGEGRMGEILKKAGMRRLTVCAGVAFIKSSFPFYYAYSLAESLCEAAKKRAKEISQTEAPSCLMFHKVQDSFVESYADMVRRELTPADGISLQYGPYYLNGGEAPEGFSTVAALTDTVRNLSCGRDDVRPALRKWLGFLYESPEKAKQWLSRVRAVHPGSKKLIHDLTEFTRRGNSSACMAYDALALCTISNQVTREVPHED